MSGGLSRSTDTLLTGRKRKVDDSFNFETEQSIKRSKSDVCLKQLDSSQLSSSLVATDSPTSYLESSNLESYSRLNKFRFQKNFTILSEGCRNLPRGCILLDKQDEFLWFKEKILQSDELCWGVVFEHGHTNFRPNALVCSSSKICHFSLSLSPFLSSSSRQ
jgi:hypothetical protein